ncbi:MORN-repeat protein [Orpheovirus IHUMI-LCC2]|uniref:MORN-repeat protein n=1 Tax=Orpheovirus IHUMI-LCC2 TaxID=2023057 RepID=A0A2I2L536_9VIRU|nr:MORN-repeat protein [Orpheovirus IHUMI-LCC2]SNW62662.1 MORN-repeat protein [Orpheovirus IHUMI-LCC2]
MSLLDLPKEIIVYDIISSTPQLAVTLNKVCKYLYQLTREIEGHSMQTYYVYKSWSLKADKYLYNYYINNITGNKDGKYTKQIRDKDNKLILIEEGYYMNNEKHGIIRTYLKNGLLRSICPYKNGKENGILYRWENDGSYYVLPYKNGLAHGRHQISRNGIITTDATYKNGILHGKYISRIDDGNMEYCIQYQNGTLHGKYITWYTGFNTEIKEKELYYRDGKKDGLYIKYHILTIYDLNKDGSRNYAKYKCVPVKYKECMYKDDKKHGEYIKYRTHPDCHTKKHNKLASTIPYTYNSKPIIKWEDKIEIKCNYVHGKKHGKYIYYNPNGSIQYTMNYKNGYGNHNNSSICGNILLGILIFLLIIMVIIDIILIIDLIYDTNLLIN